MSFQVPGPSHSKLEELNALTRPHGFHVTMPGPSARVEIGGVVHQLTTPDRFRLVVAADASPYTDPDTGADMFTEERIRDLIARWTKSI
ncbi:hypothetical protein GTV32_05335 [Gordonia sp. SID5947]|uniref:hypothetical protein n=1 Tax=Gordonia sp. SID5947 TaxID=2690315 RepID=UPI0013715CD8|nr:hypothetical protein [Gordonia sp. SID5947]MYR05767.1 hypothetical protein [Gordonia sp. SID5947]